MKEKRKEYDRFISAVEQWKNNNIDEFNVYCAKMRNMDGTGLYSTAKMLFIDTHRFVRAWKSCINDESFSDYDAIVELVSRSDFAEATLKKFKCPGNDNTIPLFISWLNFANSFETIIQVISNKIDKDSSFWHQKAASFAIKKAIDTSLNYGYRTESQWIDYLTIMDDCNDDSLGTRILRKRFANDMSEINLEVTSNESVKTNITNNYYSQQNIAIEQNISLQQNVFNHIIQVYETPNTYNEEPHHPDENANDVLMIEHIISQGVQKLEYYIQGIDNVKVLMSRIEQRIREDNRGKVYAQIKIILEEHNLLKPECRDEVKLFYNAFLLQFEHSQIKFLTLRGVQKAYGLLNAIRKTKKGEIRAKNTEEERTQIKELEHYLFEKSEA